jgi:hypothetical protein
MTHQGAKNKEAPSSQKNLLFTITDSKLKSVRGALLDALYSYNRSMPRPYEDEYFTDMKKDIQRYRSEIGNVLSGSGRESAVPSQKLRRMEGEVADFENRRIALDVQENEILDLLGLVSSTNPIEWFDYLDKEAQEDFIESLRARGADVRKVVTSLSPQKQDELIFRVLSQVSERYAGSPIFRNDPAFKTFAERLKEVKTERLKKEKVSAAA